MEMRTRKSVITAISINCDHIVPLSPGNYRSNENNAAMIWMALTRYFPDIGDTKIDLTNLNQPENVMMIASSLHSAFGRSDFSFDAVVSLSRTSLCIYTNAS